MSRSHDAYVPIAKQRLHSPWAIHEGAEATLRAIGERGDIIRRDPHEVVDAHVRRLEALRRARSVERLAEGVWQVPDDLAERGRQYDAQRLGGGVAVELKSRLPIERQARVIGATWLDQQLIGGGKGLSELGFGADAKDALRQRTDFLIDQGVRLHRWATHAQINYRVGDFFSYVM